MSIKINKTEATKTIIDAQNKMKANPNINLGTDEIVFPDGSKEKFDYNGEAVLNTGQTVDEHVPSAESKIHTETYIDQKKGVLLTPCATIVASLTEDELKATKGKKNALTKSLLLERARAGYLADALESYES